ncbi:hypothetical protein RFI_13033, partial [Reticulomyxa filosa]
MGNIVCSTKAEMHDQADIESGRQKDDEKSMSSEGEKPTKRKKKGSTRKRDTKKKSKSKSKKEEAKTVTSGMGSEMKVQQDVVIARERDDNRDRGSSNVHGRIDEEHSETATICESSVREASGKGNERQPLKGTHTSNSIAMYADVVQPIGNGTNGGRRRTLSLRGRPNPPLPRVLIIQNDNIVPFQSIGAALTAHRIAYQVIYAFHDNALENLSPTMYEAIVVIGANPCPSDDDVFLWLKSERDFLQQAVFEGVPMLAIGLGCQLVAESIGGRVFHANKGRIIYLYMYMYICVY